MLMSLNVVGYSFLLGIHKKGKVDHDHDRDWSKLHKSEELNLCVSLFCTDLTKQLIHFSCFIIIASPEWLSKVIVEQNWLFPSESYEFRK